MKWILFTLCCTGICLLSCGKKQAGSTYRLNDPELTRLMYDVQLADIAIASSAGQHGDTLKDLLWQRLTTIYGLSKEEIKTEIRKLESDPEKMKMVFDSIKVWSDTIK
jgi:hypothetical protein